MQKCYCCFFVDKTNRLELSSSLGDDSGLVEYQRFLTWTQTMADIIKPFDICGSENVHVYMCMNDHISEYLQYFGMCVQVYEYR